MNPVLPATSGQPERIDDPSGSIPPSKRPFNIASIFLGDDGLRAIWGIALFGLFYFGFRSCVDPLLRAFIPPVPGTDGSITPRWTFVFEGSSVISLAVATWLMTLIEQRKVSAYGFGRNRGVRYFLAGSACGVGLLSLLVFALHASGLLVFDARLLFGRIILRYGVIWLFGFLLVALSEEMFLRGYLQSALTRCVSPFYCWIGAPHADALGFWTAAAILSFVFGLGHSSNGGESPLGLLAAGLVGLVFCLSLWRTGSLWWAIAFHAAWDWAQSFLYGVADSGLIVKGRLFATHPVGKPILSGGLTGPEGSIYILPTVLLIAIVILLTLPRTHSGYSLREPSHQTTALDLA